MRLIIMVSKLEQFLKAKLPIVPNVLGIFSLDKELQPSNAEVSIMEILFGKSMLESEVQFLNALILIFVTFGGIMIDAKLVQPRKVLSGIFVILLGKV